MNELKQRHGFVTFWLWFSIVVNVGMSIYGLYLASINIIMLLTAFLGIVNIVAAVLLLKWRKIGFYIFMGSAVLSIISNSIILGGGINIFISFISPIVSVLIWWAILQIRKNGVSAWKLLE